MRQRDRTMRLGAGLLAMVMGMRQWGVNAPATTSLRRLAFRLGLNRLKPARAAYRASEGARYFVRGYRFGRQIPSPVVPIPADIPDAQNPLGAYFDAHGEGRAIWKWRHYFDIYDRHLRRFRGQPIHLVEIGVFGGGSLDMWREYLGPDIRVSGIDIDPACRELEHDGVEIFIGDQADPVFWERFLESAPPIDIVIDDGGHGPQQQAVTLESLLPHILPGGVYVCEDIHGPFHPFQSLLDGLTRLLSDVGLEGEYNPASSLHQQVASVHRYPILTVIEKPVACAPVFSAAIHGTRWPDHVGPSADGRGTHPRSS